MDHVLTVGLYLRERNGVLLRVLVFALCCLVYAGAACAQGARKGEALTQDVTQGALRVTQKDDTVVECPLRHTDVQASVSGFIARVTVTQTFYNPYADKIEAVYVFPLPHSSAVDAMSMVVGEHKSVGIIKRRADARALYEQALAQGQTASLLEQERPNIFTQSVGNILPQQEVKIVISYIDILKYDMGTYEFSFPMVVGPRYNASAPFAGTPVPAGATAPAPVGAMPADGVSPPVLKPGMRTGHDISLSLTLDAGVPVHNLQSPTHQATITRTGDSTASVTLSPADAIPNKDFTLRYAVVGDKPALAVMANCEESGQGYFMLMMQPKFDEALAKAPPREFVFLIDISGSMSGEPTAENIRIMQEFYKRLKTDDTIQVITFANEPRKLFAHAVSASTENVQQALNFTNALVADGGTEMLTGINDVLDEPLDPQRTRVVVMLTDGYIGNEQQVINAVDKKAGDRILFWTVGIGASPNKFLLDGIAKKGGGMSEVEGLNIDPTPLVENIASRTHSAQLAKIKIDWGNGLQVFDVYPRKTPELWPGRPVILFGRYFSGGQSTVTISGMAEGKPLSYALNVTLPDGGATANDVLAKVWARNKIEDLMAQDNYNGTPEVTEEVTQIALGFGLMSQYTSFVAVDEQQAKNSSPSATPPRRVGIPVPLPEGTNSAGFFGDEAVVPELSELGIVTSNDATAFHRMTSNAPSGSSPYGTPYAAASPFPSSSSPYGASYSAAAGAGAFTAQTPMTIYSGGGLAAGTSAMPPSPPMINSARVSIVGGYQSHSAPMSSLSKTKLAASSSPMVLQDNSLEAHDDLGAVMASMPAQELIVASAKRHDEAKAALEEALKLQQAGDLPAAFARAQQAYLLQMAAIAGYRNDVDGTQAESEKLLGALQEAISTDNCNKLPALKVTLNLIIRDQTLPEALAAVAKASRLRITILDGSLADAAALANGQTPHVTYLDLRNATVAQALDWLLTPQHLNWSVEKQGIIVGAARRQSGDSAWTYEIGKLIYPADNKLQGAKLQTKLSELQAVVLHLTHLACGQVGDDGLLPGSTVIFPGGRLLVYGNAKTHEQVVKLLDYLADARTTWDKPFNGLELALTDGKEVAAFRAVSVKNAAAYAKFVTEHPDNITRPLLVKLETLSWLLYAGATAGKVDLEALTELQVVWKARAMADILRGQNAALAYRSSWLITESASLLPKDAELAGLSAATAHLVAAQLVEVTKTLTEKPDSYLAACYAALATQSIPAKQRDALLAAVTKNSEHSTDNPAQLVATSLLAPTVKSDTALVKAISDGQIVGNDMIIMAAVAAHERGGEVWHQFCAELPELAKAAPLNGNVLLAVNHLVAARSVIAAK